MLFAPVPGSNDVWSAGVGTNLVYEVNGMQSYCIIIAGVHYYEDDYAPQSATNLTITTEYDKYYLYYSVVALATNPVDHVLYEQSPVLRDIIAEQATGTVARALTYGTPTRWTDATGCVWEAGYRYDDDWVADSSRVTHVTWISAGFEDDPSLWAIYFKIDGSIDAQVYTPPPGPTQTNSVVLAADWQSWYEGAFDFNIYRTPHTTTNLVGRVAITNDIPDVSGYATQQQATNAAVAVADAKISTNNAAFVSAVLAVPLAGADAGDLAELSEYGSYGTVGTAILALIAGLAALKRRMGTAETALAQKASFADLPYRLVTPGEWGFSGLPSGATNVNMSFDEGGTVWTLSFTIDGDTQEVSAQAPSTVLSVAFTVTEEVSYIVTATRASLPGHLLDRSGNRVVVDGDTTLTLPALVNAGKLRDFLVRLEISGSTVPTITFAAPTGEIITYETDGDEFPAPDEAGTWSYSFTENCVAHKFAVSLKKVNPVTQGGS